MILSLNEQANLFIMTVIIGSTIGFIYDIIRIIRLMIKHPKFIINLEDGIYWIFVAALMFYIMLNKNSGEIRFFNLLGVFIGMILYLLTLSRIIMKVSSQIINIIHYILNLFITIIFTPFKLIYIIFKKPINKSQNFISKKSKKALHLCKLCVKIRKRTFKKNINILLKKR